MPVSRQCRLLAVTRSVVYDQRKRIQQELNALDVSFSEDDCTKVRSLLRYLRCLS